LVALVAVPALALTGAVGRRFHEARAGERFLLGTRRHVLRGYRTRRDGRVYHPDRNPDVARILERDH